jgi:hypothetical protein
MGIFPLSFFGLSFGLFAVHDFSFTKIHLKLALFQATLPGAEFDFKFLGAIQRRQPGRQHTVVHRAGYLQQRFLTMHPLQL